MKSVGLVQIFCPVKETNRTHSRGYVEDLSTQAGRKRCAKTTVLSLSVLPQLRHFCQISLCEYHSDEIVYRHGRHEHPTRYEPPPAARRVRRPVGRLCRVRRTILIDEGDLRAEFLNASPCRCTRRSVAHDHRRCVRMDETCRRRCELRRRHDLLQEHCAVCREDSDAAFLAPGINGENCAAQLPLSLSTLKRRRRGPIASVSAAA